MEGGTGWNNEQFDACFLTSFPKAVVSNTTNPIPLVTNTDQNTPICPYPPYILFLQTPQRATSHSQAWVEQGQLYTRHPRVHPARVSAEKHLKAFKMSTGVMTRCVHCLRIAGRKQTGLSWGRVLSCSTTTHRDVDRLVLILVSTEWNVIIRCSLANSVVG